MRTKTKKATFNLPEEVLVGLDEAMAAGAAPSKNALVETALIKELNEVRRRIKKALWQKAVKDTLFLKDMKDVESDFGTADAETARRIG